MGYRIAALVGALGIVAAAAFAAATPVTPRPGAFIDPPSSPAFSWTLPADEQSDGLFIADKPDTTAEGTFPQGNLVRAHSFTNGETDWSPAAPLYAGHYWWLVSSHDRSMPERYSLPSDFWIRLSFEFDAGKVRRSQTRHWLRIILRWRGNMHALRLRASLLLHGRVVWAAWRLRENRIGSLGSTTFIWHRPRGIEQGTRLTLREGMSVPGSSAEAGALYGVRAP